MEPRKKKKEEGELFEIRRLPSPKVLYTVADDDDACTTKL